MNIDYQKMTEAAVARVATLKEIEHLVNMAESHIEPLNQLIAYVGDIDTILKRLDTEGRGMIAPELLRTLTRVAEYREQLKAVRHYSGGTGHVGTGISVIAEYAERRHVDQE